MDRENDEIQDYLDDADNQGNDYQIVFTKNVIEFAAVAREYCVFAENAPNYSKADYLTVASRLLPLLYVKTAMLPKVEPVLEDGLEEIVDYDTYENVRRKVRARLTSHDDYLEVFKEDFKYSDTPIAASISEDMADIYQDIRNFCEQYHSGDNEVMHDAVAIVEDKFRTYWGQKLCNAQQAIHHVLYSGEDLKDEEAAQEDNMEDGQQDAYGNGYGNTYGNTYGSAYGDAPMGGYGMPAGQQEIDYQAEMEAALRAEKDSMPYFLGKTGMRLVGNKKK